MTNKERTQRNDLEEYLQSEKGATVIYSKNPIHPRIKFDYPVEVTYLEEANYQTGTIRCYFCLFLNKEFIMNSIKLDFPVPHLDLVEIAKNMVDEYISKCDFSDLDKLMDGKTPCGNYDGVYKSCEECPEYRLNDESKDRDCMGGMFSCCPYLNFWNLEYSLKEKYGQGSAYYEEYLNSRARKLCSLMERFIQDNPKWKKPIIKRLKKCR